MFVTCLFILLLYFVLFVRKYVCMHVSIYVCICIYNALWNYVYIMYVKLYYSKSMWFNSIQFDSTHYITLNNLPFAWYLLNNTISTKSIYELALLLDYWAFNNVITIAKLHYITLYQVILKDRQPVISRRPLTTDFQAKPRQTEKSHLVKLFHFIW